MGKDPMAELVAGLDKAATLAAELRQMVKSKNGDFIKPTPVGENTMTDESKAKVYVVTEEYAEEDYGQIIGIFADKEKALSFMQESADAHMAEERENWGKYSEEEKGKDFDAYNKAERDNNIITISKYQGIAKINGLDQPYWPSEKYFQVDEYELQ